MSGFTTITEKLYAKIPHLPGSRMDTSDHLCEDWQVRICTGQVRDDHDTVIVTEKLDGSCVAVHRQDGLLIPLLRSGALASSSRSEQHHLFHQWVLFQQDRFLALLGEGERACCEWLAQAHGTRYALPHEPLVIFDLMTAEERVPFAQLAERASVQGFVTPRVISHGPAISMEAVRQQLDASGHGALDPGEGAVWRVERHGRFGFIAKWVRPDKVDGFYLPKNPGEPGVWNWRPDWS